MNTEQPVKIHRDLATPQEKMKMINAVGDILNGRPHTDVLEVLAYVLGNSLYVIDLVNDGDPGQTNYEMMGFLAHVQSVRYGLKGVVSADGEDHYRAFAKGQVS